MQKSVPPLYREELTLSIQTASVYSNLALTDNYFNYQMGTPWELNGYLEPHNVLLTLHNVMQLISQELMSIMFTILISMLLYFLS